MDNFLSKVELINNAINGFVWGLPMLVLLVGTGILMTCLTKFFQISHFKHWDDMTEEEKHELSICGFLKRANS